jgi:hypothetical protein
LLRDSGLRSAQALAKKLERCEVKNGFTAREVRRHQWTGLKTERSVETALEWVEDCGWVRGMRPTFGQMGRPTTRYEIHPDLSEGVGESPIGLKSLAVNSLLTRTGKRFRQSWQ